MKTPRTLYLTSVTPKEARDFLQFPNVELKNFPLLEDVGTCGEKHFAKVQCTTKSTKSPEDIERKTQ
jgi:hypothetical protein